MSDETKTENPLGTRPVGKLLLSLAVPGIIANVVNALYNIVDQIFIGQGVGELGNAATTVAFPLTTICMAIGLMAGIGSASGFNLELGRKQPEKARQIAGAAAGFLVVSGVIICALVIIFLRPMLRLFGATGNIMPYAMQYAGITAFGIPFLLFSTGTNPLVRADGSPRYSMVAIIVGALLNTILDPIFIFRCGWGVAGAAWATVISQVISAVILAAYFPRFKSVKFAPSDYIPRPKVVFKICKLGLNSFVFQTSNLLVQITSNNMLRIYGASSVYGADTAIAIAGIVSKIQVIYISLVIGLINGSQPICSYNYGAKRYTRVRRTMRLLIRSEAIVAVFFWLVFELFPAPIISIFGGSGSDTYMQFGIRYMRGYFCLLFLAFVQPIGGTFFPAIGKAAKGAILSFTRSIVFLIPLLILLPRFFGVDGIMFAQPATDLLSAIMAAAFLIVEFRNMPKEDVIEGGKGNAYS